MYRDNVYGEYIQTVYLDTRVILMYRDKQFDTSVVLTHRFTLYTLATAPRACIFPHTHQGSLNNGTEFEVFTQVFPQAAHRPYLFGSSL